MFKKTLLALAVSAMAFNASAALTIGATVNTVSLEGTATGSAVALLNAPVATQALTSSGGYTTFNGINVALSGASFNPATAFTITIDDASGNPGATVVGTPTALTSPTHFTVVFKTASRAEITFKQAGLDELELTNDGLADPATAATFTVAGIVLNQADFSDKSKANITIETASNIPGTNLETGSGTVATGTTQFKATVAKNSTEIDVANDRKTFVSTTAGPKLTQTFTVTTGSVATNINAASAAGKKVTNILKGDFSWLDADSDGKLDTGVSLSAAVTGAETPATTVVVATDMKSVSATYTIGAGILDGAILENNIITWSLTTDGVRTIPVSAITSDVSFPYAVTGTADVTFASVGDVVADFKLNGDTAHVPFMPFSSAFSQSVTVTNKGSVDAIITIDWYAGADKKVSDLLTLTAAPYAVTDISSAVRAAAAARGFTGNMAFDVVVNAPNETINVSALYYSKADKDRGVVGSTL